jgi:post-segregation antitoxin (ccd killing protein)
MRDPLFDPKAPKQTVSVTLNSDLYAKAKSLGLNASRVAEEALVEAYSRRLAEEMKAELRQDLAAAESYADEHGRFADFVREQYQNNDGSV